MGAGKAGNPFSVATTKKQMALARTAFVAVCVAAVLCSVMYIQSETAVAEDEASVKMVAGSAAQVLDNIAALKSYAITAIGDAKKLKAAAKTMKFSILANLLIKLGQVNRKNTVTEYSDAIGELKAKYRGGFQNYILLHLDHAVTVGKGVVLTKQLDGTGRTSKKGLYAILDKKAIGLQSQPKYFETLAQRYSAFSAVKVKIDTISRDADHQAAAAWLGAGSKKRYKSFAETIQGKIDAKRSRFENKISSVAMDAEVAKFRTDLKKGKKKNELAIPQPITAVATGAAYNNKHPFNSPSEKGVKDIARKKAAGWVESNKGKKLTKVIKTVELNEAAKIKKGREILKKQKLKAKMKASLRAEKKTDTAAQRLLKEALGMVHNREMKVKEKAAKKKERADKEKAYKAEKVAKEKASKEKAAKAKQERRDKVLEKEQKKRHKERLAKAEQAQKRAERAKKEANSKEFNSKAQLERNQKAEEARTKKIEKEVKYKRVVTQCSTTRYWDGQCTLCPAHWYTSRHCPSGGSLVGEKGCGFMNAGCLGLCARQDCRQVRVRL